MRLSRIAVYVLILAGLMMVVTACGDADDSSPKKPTTQKPAKPATTTDEASDEVAAPTCSSTGLNLKLPVESTLPKPVDITRQRLFNAAMTCDFDALGAIIKKGDDTFTFSYGIEKNPIVYWQAGDTENKTMARLAQILTTPVTKDDSGDTLFTWPSAFADTTTTAQWQELQRSGAYSADDIATFKKAESYLGYRVGITSDGTWSYFVAGD